MSKPSLEEEMGRALDYKARVKELEAEVEALRAEAEDWKADANKLRRERDHWRDFIKGIGRNIDAALKGED